MAKAAPILALISGTDALLGLLGAYTGILSPLVGFYLFAAGALLGGLLTVIVSGISLFRSRGGRNPEASRLAFAGLAVGIGLLLIVAAAGSPGSTW